jgi:protein-L-isoaspartate(D-aspartate) O-methyltransferase
MLTVPRERFVPAAFAPVAYMEGDIPLGPGRVLLEPRSFAKLLQLANIGPNDRVLDIACGTGYSTAILSFLGADIVGLEDSAELAGQAQGNLQALGLANTRVITGTLTAGCPKEAPFDVIFLNGAITREPLELLAQLGDGGRLVAIRREGAGGKGVIFLNHEGAWGERSVFDANTPVLPGFEKPASFLF